MMFHIFRNLLEVLLQTLAFVSWTMVGRAFIEKYGLQITYFFSGDVSFFICFWIQLVSIVRFEEPILNTIFRFSSYSLYIIPPVTMTNLRYGTFSVTIVIFLSPIIMIIINKFGCLTNELYLFHSWEQTVLKKQQGGFFHFKKQL